jgi:Zn-dependent peptidase ImmA (M78 family)
MSSTPMPENISGFISREGDAWVLGVNSLHHPNRQRFTIAHEIGHFLLHRDHGSFHDGLLFRRDDELNQQEREANQFAALVLMPEADFKTVVRRMPVEDAAKLFGVSAQAAKYRYATVSAQFGID